MIIWMLSMVNFNLENMNMVSYVYSQVFIWHSRT